ncbi:tyrosine-type recombinase/integrase [Nonomuraea sp. NPDC059007]|uniref:tyrosine-type recombinase/integrase n=1 Tax=Nonomuraea sp. NPDC059007 TaxID=3346692 RepID=UPI003695736A
MFVRIPASIASPLLCLSVFPSFSSPPAVAGPLHPQHVTDRFYAICYQAGLPPIRLHDLRHLAATAVLAVGADIKLVQEALGHKTASFTRDTYTSVYPEAAAAAAEATAAFLTGTPAPRPRPLPPTRRATRAGANGTASGETGGTVIHLPTS